MNICVTEALPKSWARVNVLRKRKCALSTSSRMMYAHRSAPMRAQKRFERCQRDKNIITTEHFSYYVLCFVILIFPSSSVLMSLLFSAPLGFSSRANGITVSRVHFVCKRWQNKQKLVNARTFLMRHLIYFADRSGKWRCSHLQRHFCSFFSLGRLRSSRLRRGCCSFRERVERVHSNRRRWRWMCKNEERRKREKERKSAISFERKPVAHKIMKHRAFHFPYQVSRLRNGSCFAARFWNFSFRSEKWWKRS